MNNHCRICDGFTSDDKILCRECKANISAAFHPIFCMTCNTVVWLDNRVLNQTTKKAIEEMQSNHGTVAFARKTCSVCKEKME